MMGLLLIRSCCACVLSLMAIIACAHGENNNAIDSFFHSIDDLQRQDHVQEVNTVRDYTRRESNWKNEEQATTTTESSNRQSLSRRRVDEESNGNTLCSEYLLQFLEGTTDAHDTCDGIKNAYMGANCAAYDKNSEQKMSDDDDDYFGKFTEHTCCTTLLTHYSSYCALETHFSNSHLLLAAMALMLAECAKGLAKFYDIHCIPEAGICALVGTLCGFIASLIPGANLDDMSFDDDLFMKFLLPPIIFEAALSVSKIQFRKRRSAILFFAILGTLISTVLTGLMVHYFSSLLRSTTFPMLDSLVFGALISSVDPVAILSVLSNLGLSQTDTVFILVFGESLLNDGIAITVFKTLASRFDGRTHDDSTTVSDVFGVIADFLNAMFGSIIVAVVCGMAAWYYFKMLKRTLSPAMEVGSFFLWALTPFYISEALEWSGIVALVAMGFFMDVYIASPKAQTPPSSRPSSEVGACIDSSCHAAPYVEMGSDQSTTSGTESVVPLRGTERMRLSREAEKHIRFVAHLASQLAENAIFAYLGLFLFSQHYDWDPAMISIAIASCLVSRVFVVVFLSQVILMIYSCRGRGPNSRGQTAAAIEDPRTQIVLVLAGLRGAVSLSLMEDIPIYNALTNEGCEYKGLMKGMTSATIIFTTFVLGGGTYYLLPHLGFSQTDSREGDNTPRGLGSVELATPTPGGTLRCIELHQKPDSSTDTSDLTCNNSLSNDIFDGSGNCCEPTEETVL